MHRSCTLPATALVPTIVGPGKVGGDTARFSPTRHQRQNAILKAHLACEARAIVYTLSEKSFV